MINEYENQINTNESTTNNNNIFSTVERIIQNVGSATNELTEKSVEFIETQSADVFKQFITFQGIKHTIYCICSIGFYIPIVDIILQHIPVTNNLASRLIVSLTIFGFITIPQLVKLLNAIIAPKIYVAKCSYDLWKEYKNHQKVEKSQNLLLSPIITPSYDKWENKLTPQVVHHVG